MASLLDTITSAVKKVGIKGAGLITDAAAGAKDVAVGIGRAIGTEEGRQNIEGAVRDTIGSVITEAKKTGGDSPGFIDVAAGLGKTFTKAQDEYSKLPDANKSRILDVIGGVGSAPVMVGGGYAGALDTTKSKAERTASATDAVLGLVSLAPGVAQAQGIYNFVVPQAAKSAVSAGISKFTENVLIPNIKKFGADDKDAEAISKIALNGANILAGVLGGKVSKPIGEATRKSFLGTVNRANAAKIGKLTDTIIDTTVQSTPDIFAMAYDAYKEGGESKAGDILLTAMANNAVAFPGLKALKTKPSDMQMKLDTEAKLTPTSTETYVALAGTLPGKKDSKGITGYPKTAYLDETGKKTTDITKAKKYTKEEADTSGYNKFPFQKEGSTEIYNPEITPAKSETYKERVAREDKEAEELYKKHMLAFPKYDATKDTKKVRKKPIPLQEQIAIEEGIKNAKPGDIVKIEGTKAEIQDSKDGMYTVKFLEDKPMESGNGNLYSKGDIQEGKVRAEMDMFFEKGKKTKAKSKTPTPAIPKETPVAQVKEVTPPIAKSETTPVLNKKPEMVMVKDIAEGLLKTKEGETFRIDIPGGTEFINKGGKAEYADFGVIRTDDDVITGVKEVPTFAETIIKTEPTVTAIKEAKKITKKGGQTKTLAETVTEATQKTTPSTAEIIPHGKKGTAEDLDFMSEEGKDTIYKEDPELSLAVDAAKSSSQLADVSDAKLTFGGLTAKGARAQANIMSGGIRGWLNEIRLGAEKIMAGNYLQQLKGNMVDSIARAIFDKGNTANDIVVIKGIKPMKQLDAADLEGVTSPNGHVYTKADTIAAVETANKANEEYTKKHGYSGVERNVLNDVRNTGNIFSYFRNSPEILAKYFTPEQISQLQALDIFNKNTKIYGSASAKAIKDGEFSKNHPIFEEYSRYVITPESAKRSGVFSDEITVEMSDGSQRTFKNLADAARYENAAIHTGQVRIKPESLSSLTKSAAGPELDPYRIHDPVTQLMDYALEMGTLYGDVEGAKFLDTLFKSKNKDVRDYSRTILNKTNEGALGDLIGAKGSKNPTIKSIVDATSYAGVFSKMFANVSSVLNSTLGTTVRGAVGLGANTLRALKDPMQAGAILADTLGGLRQIGKVVTDSLSSIPFIKNIPIQEATPTLSKGYGQEVYQVLEKNGFISEYDLMENQRGLVSLFANTPYENAIKATTALANMRLELVNAGKKPGLSPESVAREWENFRKEGGDKFWAANDRVLSNSNYISAIHAYDRSQVPIFGSMISPLKKWVMGQARDTWKSATDIVDYATSRGKTTSGAQAIDAGQRVFLQGAMAFYGTQAIWKSVFEQQGYTEEQAEELAKNQTKKMLPHPTEQFKDVVKSFPSSIGADFVIDTLKVGGQLIDSALADTRQERNTHLTEAASLLKKSWKALQTAEDFGYSIEDKIGESLGALTQKDATAAGVARLNTPRTNFEDTLKKYFGGDVDRVMENKAYKFLDSNTLDKTLPPWMQTTLLVMKDVYNQWDQDLVNLLPAGEIGGVRFGAKETTSATDESIMDKKIRSQYTFQSAELLNNPEVKSFADVYKKLGFSDENAKFLETETNRMIQAREGKKVTGKDFATFDYNKDVKESTGFKDTQYATIFRGKDFNEDIKLLREENPYVYNYVVGLVGNMKYLSDQGTYNPEGTKNLKTSVVFKKGVPIGSQLKAYSGPTTQDDRAISEFHGSEPLTTAYINSVEQALAPKEGMTNEKILKNLRTLENLNKFIIDNSNTLHPYQVAMGLKAVEFNKILTKLGTNFQAIAKEFPNTAEMLRTGLRTRGELLNGGGFQEQPETISSIVQKTGTGVGKGYTSDISLPDTTGGILIDKKKLKDLELPSGGKVPKVGGVGAQKSLAELLNSPGMKQAMSRGGQLQTREPLATFSKNLNQR